LHESGFAMPMRLFGNSFYWKCLY